MAALDEIENKIAVQKVTDQYLYLLGIKYQFEEIQRYIELIQFTEDQILMSKRYLDFERDRIANKECSQ